MENKNVETTLIPVITNVRMMTDDEWNKLAYKNWLERNGSNGQIFRDSVLKSIIK